MSLSEIIDVTRFDDPEWDALHKDLATYNADAQHVFRHTAGNVNRKGYEWTQCIYGFSKLGLIKPNAKALGVGAGREPVIFWLSDRVGHVTATDLYGNEEWSFRAGAEASDAVVKSPEKFCPRPIDTSKLTFENANGTALPYGDGSFDLCWSLSSIEHFGGHEASRKAVQEMVRVLRPGGVACIATEFLLLNDQPHPEYFNRADLQKYVIEASEDAELVDGMNWSLPPIEYLIDSVALWEHVGRFRRHVILNDGSHQWTSAIVFLRRISKSRARIRSLRAKRKWFSFG